MLLRMSPSVSTAHISIALLLLVSACSHIYCADVTATSSDVTVTPLERNVVCHDHTSRCSDDSTCCQINDHTWGCCPLPQARCCDDLKHCCPQNTLCDLEKGGCISIFKDYTNSYQPWWTKIKPLQKTTPEEGIAPHTLAELPQQELYRHVNKLLPNRMPLVNKMSATEIRGRHYERAAARTSNQGRKHSDSLLWRMLRQGALEDEDVDAVICPDKVHMCPDGQTCCWMFGEEWGCCPYPNAVCCSDGACCCPEHYHCDLVQHLCVADSLH